MVKVSVIVPTLNRSRSLQKCLDSLTNQTFRDFETIVVDGGSNDDTKDIVSCYSAKFLLQPGAGRCNARNFGIHHAKGKIIAFVDDDVIVAKDWLKRLVKLYELGDNVGGVGGRSIYIPSNLGRPSRAWKLVERVLCAILHGNDPAMQGRVIGVVPYWNLDKGERIKEVDWISGCNMSFTKEALDAIDGFDENFYGVSWCEEIDVCLRIKKAGYKIVYNPEALVYHYQATRVEKVSELIDNVYYFALKHDLLEPSNWLHFTTYAFMISYVPAWKSKMLPVSYLYTWMKAFRNAYKRNRRRLACG